MLLNPTDNKKLKERYYLDNFLSLINYVKDNYSDMLHKEELSFVSEFKKLSINAKSLYVRLITRKGPFFRLDKLKYVEIKDIKSSVNEMINAGFVEINPEGYLEYVIQTITKIELVKFVNENSENISIDKNILIIQ